MLWKGVWFIGPGPFYGQNGVLLKQTHINIEMKNGCYNLFIDILSI